MRESSVVGCGGPAGGGPFCEQASSLSLPSVAVDLWRQRPWNAEEGFE